MAGFALFRALPATFMALALLCMWAFHERYWSRRDCFNELGRCFDPGAGVVYTEAGAAWGVLALLLIGASAFLMAIGYWFSHRRRRVPPRKS